MTELQKLKLREKFTRSWYKESDRPQLPERVCEVTIQVYPNAKAVELPKRASQRMPPFWQTATSTFVLFSRMAWHRVRISIKLVVSTTTRKHCKQATVVKIKGHPLHIVQYFIGFLYNNQHTCTQQESWGLADWVQVLQIADEYEDMALFDKVSIALMAQYLKPIKQGCENVILLLKSAYKYSRETSELLRKGCISFCTDNYYILLRQPAFKEFVKEFACGDLGLAMTITFQEIIEEAEDQGEGVHNVWIPIVDLDKLDELDEYDDEYEDEYEDEPEYDPE
ncbi:hypothetical protein DFS34DRAFT_79975 [Phlyctochytrium arcticum]|nr:hypothetical protein DFS34DRAFT_79975 [Phlyctochytrium arcticum]